jgi:tRNA(Ile)-lysidine synthase
MEAVCERNVRVFLDTLRDSLRGATVIAAVSGGSDSVAMLVLLHRAAPRYGYSLRAVTVNHMIRLELESAGDAEFAAVTCASLVPPVPCRVERVEPGEIARLSLERGRGIEDAARCARYSILERCAREDGASIVMTGHTANDQAETRLMRFLQGASGSSLAGFEPSSSRAAVRFVKPLLACAHDELRAFLAGEGIAWREDSTNADDRFLRNRVRLRVVPVLDRHFPGWKTGLESGAERQRLDEDLARSLVNVEWRVVQGGIECRAGPFFAMHPAVRLRFLRDGLNLLSSLSGTSMPRRVSGGYLMEIARMPALDEARKCASGLAFSVSGDRVFWRSDIVHTAKTGYLVYIRETGTYRFPFGALRVTGDRSRSFIDGRIGPFSLPITVRTRLAGDSVRAADGRHKKLKKLMNDWSVPESGRNRVPLVERDGEIIAVYGSPLGYPDWIVQP